VGIRQFTAIGVSMLLGDSAIAQLNARNWFSGLPELAVAVMLVFAAIFGRES